MKKNKKFATIITQLRKSLCCALFCNLLVSPVLWAEDNSHSPGPANNPLPTAALPLNVPASLPVESRTESPSHLLLKGQVNYVVPRGTSIKLKLATVPTTGLHLEERDLEGNLPPARLNQEITARTAEDLYVDDNKVIPEGTIFHGHVSRILPPRRASRPGSLVISFDYFKTPDGRQFAFRAEADNFKASTKGTKAHGIGIVAGYAAGGAVMGALVAYEAFGLDKTIALHGYNIAGGAALGAVAATTYAILKHGPRAVLEPGDNLNMQIDTDLLLPAATEPTVKKEPEPNGIEVEVLKSKVIKDGFDGRALTLEALVTNNTDTRLKSLDLFVVDDNGNRYPISAEGDIDSDMLFDVDPHSMKRVSIRFELEYPKLHRKLVWLDHASHHVLVSQRLP